MEKEGFVIHLTKRKLSFVFIFFTLMLIGGVSAIVPNPGHSWNQMECDNQLCISNGKIGVGTATPGAKLHVVDNGGIKLESNSFPNNYLKLGMGVFSGRIQGFIESTTGLNVTAGVGKDMVIESSELVDGNLNTKKTIVQADGDLVSDGNIYYGGGTNDGNKVCRKDGTNCPPNANPSLSCSVRAGGRNSGAVSVSCQSGEVMTGGGCQVFPIIGQSALNQFSYPRLSNTWTCDYGGYESKPYAICCKII